MKPVRFFTQGEANALMERLQPRVRELRRTYDVLVECSRHVEDIGIVYGEKAKDPTCEAFPEWQEYAERFQLLSANVQHLVDGIQALGAQVKDPAVGLLDFYAKRGAEVVFLCWRLGEERVEHWHTLAEGFTGRKPIAQVDLP